MFGKCVINLDGYFVNWYRFKLPEVMPPRFRAQRITSKLITTQRGLLLTDQASAMNVIALTTSPHSLTLATSSDRGATPKSQRHLADDIRRNILKARRQPSNPFERYKG